MVKQNCMYSIQCDRYQLSIDYVLAEAVGSVVDGIDETFTNRSVGRLTAGSGNQSANCFVVKVSKAVLQIVTCSHGTFGREG
jgi:hypothetical protein